MTAPDAPARLRDVFRRDRAWVAARLSDWFYDYHDDLFRHGVPFEVYERKVRAIRDELGDARRVLDLGAGFGVHACLLRLAGVPEVVALDYHAGKTRAARALVGYLGIDGVHVLQGDALALPFRPDTFDGALALASLSHVRDAASALRSLARAVRPGGRLYVFEDNNSRWPGYAERMEPVWEGAETGRYPGEFPTERQLAESYVAIRTRLLRERFPQIAGPDVDRLAKETRGLHGRLLEGAVEGWLRSGRLENPRANLVCHPVSGEFEEYPLHPDLVLDLVRDAGFEPRLRSPHHGPFRGRARLLKRAAAGLFALFPGLLRRRSPIFAVSAVRRDPSARG
jgi:SAM-dependent methyltransferase